ncbi:MAG: 50S ribosomal protein L3 N(5)-glutamine methyltransferase [Gammaproteobacteria bacterium]|jgi:ribosomal protein L3 glutamine methyltransferase|nr:50S ribosomal protein L3 N(5)-glutamine methyltransferase [Gammaproteobacteria bacterium]
MPNSIRLHELIASITARFDAAGLVFGHGTSNAHDEACWLAAHALAMDVAAELPDVELSPAQRLAIDELTAVRLKQRQPLAYLLGEAWFCGLPFTVDQHTLVPRSPLAELINEQFQPWLDMRSKQTLLDIGTGSGCIAIACAKTMPWLQVSGSDIDAQALCLADGNAQRHGLGDRCRWLEADVFCGIDESFDVIISNPPYVPAMLAQTMPREYQHEPAHALFSGVDGLDHAAAILLDAADHLQAQGVLVLELGESAALLQQQLSMLPFIWPDLEHGGEGVIIAELGMLQRHEHAIKSWYQQRQQRSKS